MASNVNELPVTTTYSDHLFHLKKKRLHEIALKKIHEQGQKNDKFFLICIQVDSMWKSIVDLIMPGHDWQKIREVGKTPIAQGSVSWSVLNIIASIVPEITDELLERPKVDIVKVVILTEDNVSIYELNTFIQLN